MSLGRELFVVGIGSSACGIEALQAFFKHLPERSGMGFVLVSHLAPGRESLLHEVVGRFTPLPVRQATDGMKVEPDHVYIIPPAGALELEGGRLRVGRRPSGHHANPIDLFLSSLAADQGERAIGVLLSGGGSDGTAGFRALKEAGGLTMAQGTDQSAPRHASMPDSATVAGLVDMVVPVEEMPAKLVSYIQTFNATLAEVRGGGRKPGDDGATAAKREISAILHDQVGHDFAGYKQQTFLRRVQRRMQLLQIISIKGYIDRMRADPEEVTCLFQDLLIGVTSFFRDPEAFEALQAAVLPKLLEAREPGDAIRVWVPGCSTGEEVYSIAIALREQFEARRILPKVQVFGTDIDERALAVARAGRYSAGAGAGMAPERLRRFFTEDAGWHVLAKEVREMCIFSAHSLIRDPPFSRIDLISCRNLLIYLDAALQDQVIPTFHYALRPGGFLFLGHSESVSQHGGLFDAVDKKHRIYQRRDHAHPHARVPLRLPGQRRPADTGGQRLDTPAAATILRRVVEARVVERFAPAHVVVNGDGDVVFYSMRTGRYLEQPSGTPSRHVLAMARKGLRLDLRQVLHEATETRRPLVREGVAVEIDDRVQRIDLVVEPMETQDSEPLYLVLFVEQGPALTLEEAGRERSAPMSEPERDRLDAELRDTRERLQVTIEEYETALEELKAANEELVSMNEELQSTNEELETSKEEIQSINEELQTVNSELEIKVNELNHTNADLANVLDSTRIALVFLDRELIIRSFTPAVTEIFSLIPTDQGRPLTDIATNLDYAELADDVRQVLRTDEPIERRVTRADGAAHFLTRVMPYRVADRSVSGVLLIFVDITAPVQAEQQQRLLVNELNHRVRNMLAVVSALASQTLARTPEPEAFAASFLGRVQALARSHALLAREQWRDIGLAELLAGELAAYVDGDAGRVRLAGPPVVTKPKAALALGLVAHELATNAMKHGALAVPEGRVEVSWAVEATSASERSLLLRWRETGAAVPETGAVVGFGTLLVEREVRHELGGAMHREYRPDGLELTITLPFEPLLQQTDGAAAEGRPAAS